MPVIAALAALLLSAAPADAFFVKPTIRQTLGSRNYAATYGAVDFGEDFHIKPNINSYHSNDATGTYKTYGVRAAYAWEKYELAATGGFSPRVSGYANHFAGGEGSISFDFEEGGADRAEEAKTQGAEKKASTRKFGVSRLDLTGSLMHTQHSDQFVPTVTNGVQTLTQSTQTFDLGQTDLEAIIGVEVTKSRLELDITKSVYNKDLARIGARSAQVAFLSGLNGVIQGFPDLNVNVRVDLEEWDVWTPYVSWTHTNYKIQQPPSSAYTLGLSAAAKGFFFDASFQRLDQRGQTSRNYVSAQASYRFE